jgi:hypothetical protein
MAWDVEFTDEFGEWWEGLTSNEQASVDFTVRLLEAKGPSLDFPHSSQIKGSKHGNMRELRVQHAGQPYRVFYAFDPRRMAILLIGGHKTGDDQFYDRMVPAADKIYDEHLVEIGHGKKVR